MIAGTPLNVMATAQLSASPFTLMIGSGGRATGVGVRMTAAATGAAASGLHSKYPLRRARDYVLRPSFFQLLDLGPDLSARQ